VFLNYTIYKKMDIFKYYINPRNIDLVCKLYGFQVPPNVILHYEIKREYFLDYISNAKFLKSNRQWPNGGDYENYTISELRSILYEGKNVNYWEYYRDFIGSLHIQKNLDELEEYEVFKKEYFVLDKFKLKMFRELLKNNPIWNYEKHLKFVIKKIANSQDLEESNQQISKLIKACIYGKNMNGLISIFNYYTITLDMDIIKYAYGAWDLEMLNFLKDEGFDIYLKYKNIVYCMDHFWRYDKLFLQYLLGNGFEAVVIERLFSTGKIYNYPMLCSDILNLSLSSLKKRKFNKIDVEYIYPYINNTKFNFLKKILDFY